MRKNPRYGEHPGDQAWRDYIDDISDDSAEAERERDAERETLDSPDPFEQE